MEETTIGLYTKLYIALEQALVKIGLLLPPGIHYIGGSDILPPPLSKSEECRAIEALERGDEQAKKILIEHNLRLVVFLARKFESSGVGTEDLISIGTIGLIKAVISFDPEKGNRLAAYASRCVENEILM